MKTGDTIVHNASFQLILSFGLENLARWYNRVKARTIDTSCVAVTLGLENI